MVDGLPCQPEGTDMRLSGKSDRRVRSAPNHAFIPGNRCDMEALHNSLLNHIHPTIHGKSIHLRNAIYLIEGKNSIDAFFVNYGTNTILYGRPLHLLHDGDVCI